MREILWLEILLTFVDTFKLWLNCTIQHNTLLSRLSYYICDNIQPMLIFITETVVFSGRCELSPKKIWPSKCNNQDDYKE